MKVNEMDEIRLARVMLTWLAEPGTWSVYRLVQRHGPVGALHRILADDVPDRKLRKSISSRMPAGDPYQIASAAIEHADRLGARVVVPEDPEWPHQLSDLELLSLSSAERRVDQETAPPLCFWVRGAWQLDEAFEHSVAVVGSRAATSYGIHVATTIGYGLADREWTVVSGGAYGIDSAAHRGALNAGGRTITVLACGVDRPYPASNTALFDRIAETGLLMSEWLPGADPLRPRFLIRNRVIAAATRGTVVVEASARSGATQTMRRALAIGRRSMVVPGPVTSAMSVGAHELLRADPQTRLVTGAAQILEEVGRIGADLAPLPRGPQRPHDLLDDESSLLLESLPGRGTTDVDTLAARASLDVRTALRRLSMLEDLGLVIRRDGGYALAPRRPDRPVGSPAEPGGQTDGSAIPSPA